MRLYTNRPDFFNDISEEIRLYLPKAELEIIDVSSIENPLCISTDSEETYILASLTNDEEHFRAFVRFGYDGVEYSYNHSTPYRNEDALAEKRYAKRCIKVAVFRCLSAAFPSAHIPWGSLTGIRPTRLLRELVKSEGETEAHKLMLHEFDVSPAKLALAARINSVQQPILDSIEPKDVDVYVGIPFCRTRCLYCSFASQLRTRKTDMTAYLNALKKDISLGAEMAHSHGLKIRALYLGGGTPTILTAEELDELLYHIIHEYGVAPETEFTVEAGRPDTITEEKLHILLQHGVTRISVNPQTMCDETLKSVGRDHRAEDIINCFYTARRMGFDCINMDLIAGLPGEDHVLMEKSIDKILPLLPDCLTVHTLAVKRSSRLHEHLDEIVLPDIHEVEQMTAIAAEGAEKMGMLPYYMYRQKYMAGNMENVGYSMPDKICIYNIDMMEDALSIIAHGAGAMTKRVFPNGHRIERVPNPKDIDTYISKIDSIDAARRKLWTE